MPNSKHKGNSWEREAAASLSEWYGEEFKRVPASGALRWGGVTWTYGDLLPPLNLPLVVECKHWHEVSIDQLLGTTRKDPGQGQVADWWYKQTIPDAQRASQELGVLAHPLLLWKQDRCPARLCLTWDLFNRLDLQKRLTSLTLSFPEREGFIVLSFTEFLKVTVPATFRDAITTSA